MAKCGCPENDVRRVDIVTRGRIHSLAVGLIALLSLPLGCSDVEEDQADLYDPPAGIGKADGASDLDWPVLRRGDSNRAVVSAQYLLRFHGQSLSLNGLFDDRTETAAIDFQGGDGLVQSGVVGPSTWESLVVLVGFGDRSDAVKGVQDQLNRQHGFEIPIDGEFDNSTREAVFTFQEEHCLDADGWVGLQTWNALVTDDDQCSSGGSGSFGPARLLGLHATERVTLWDRDFGRGRNGADALSNIRDAAAGASSSCSPGAPCFSVRLDGRMLDAMVTLADDLGFTYFVTSISGGFHSSNSFHYSGRAFDVDEVNGIRISGDSSMSRAFMSACRSLGAIEVLGPSNDPSGHFDHIHCAF